VSPPSPSAAVLAPALPYHFRDERGGSSAVRLSVPSSPLFLSTLMHAPCCRGQL
jgi:hypothetical protein